MPDEELYTRIRAGDGDALAELYNRYVVKVQAIVRRLVYDPQVVEEVIQDVFMRVWTTTAYNPSLGQFDHWICIVARRMAIDHLRKQERRKDVPSSEQIYSDITDHGGAVDGVEASMSKYWLHEDLAYGMSLLRPEERLILQLAYLEGQTLAEIANALQIPLGTVKTRLHHGLKKMRSGMTDRITEVPIRR